MPGQCHPIYHIQSIVYKVRVNLGLQGTKLGYLFTFVLDNNIINKLTEAVFQNEQFFVVGYMKFFPVKVFDIMDIFYGSGKSNNRSAQAADNRVDN